MWLHLEPVLIDACVPLVLRLLSGGVQSPRRHSGVTRAFIFKGSGCYGAKMGQREAGGNEDFGLKRWPHQQDYNPQLIKASTELVVFRDALPAPLNLRKDCWLSVPGTVLCLNSHPGWSGGWGLEIRLSIIFSRVVSYRWHPATHAFSWRFPTFPS